MSSKSNVKPTSILHEILTWSNARPDWQRDALRRIIMNGSIDATDLKELERICRAKHKADTSNAPAVAVEAITKAHLPPAPEAAESVSLISVGELKHVNRLPSDQIIPFGAGNGLTIIYGDNGSGKSGYARVIKKACRARGVPPIIRADAFAPPPAAKASAEIVFQVSGTTVTVTWTDGVSADPRLANVFVFDSFTAGHYINDDSPAAFTPFGLDVLPVLSKTCDAIHDRIQQDINIINDAINTVASNWKYDTATEVGKLVSKLSAASKGVDVSSLCGLDATQEKTLQDIREALKSEPLQKAKETRATATRLDSFAKKVVSITDALADEKVESLKKLVDDVKTTEAAAKAFASGQFGAEYLDGTGTEFWRAMWEAGREYSVSSAYKGQAFPYIDDKARCVFCQQDLDDEAVKRLKAFEVFCADKSQQMAVQATKRLTDATAKLELVGSISPELEKLDADLARMTQEQRVAEVEFANKADERLKTVQENLCNKIWDIPATLPTAPAAAIKDLCAALETRAKTEESAHDPEIRKKLLAQRAELEAREWLAGVKADVLAQIERYKDITRLKTSQKDTATAAITTKSTELTKQFVTEAFRLRFSHEVKALGLRTLGVTLEPIQGKKGETKFGLRLVPASSHKVMDIASEGEQRCIALAAFLSELSQASHQSALVFDDPVSSLDQWRREKIAERLVAEAKHRQVIVFTHDVVFLSDLMAFADKTVMVPNVLTLEWNDGVPGQHIKGLPWDRKKPLECLAELENNQKAISTKWNPQPNAANVEAMRHAYSRLRSTLERIVEVELLDGIVCRFESQVNAGRVKSLIGITQGECDEAKRLLQKCHKITDAHAPSNAAIPDPAELTKDITDAKQLVTDIRKRKNHNQVLGGKP